MVEQLAGAPQPGDLTESVQTATLCILPCPGRVPWQVGTHQVQGFLLMALLRRGGRGSSRHRYWSSPPTPSSPPTWWMTPRLAVAVNLAQLVAFLSHSRFSRRKVSAVVPQCMNPLATTTPL